MSNCAYCGHLLAHDLTGRGDKIVHWNKGKIGKRCTSLALLSLQPRRVDPKHIVCKCDTPLPSEVIPEIEKTFDDFGRKMMESVYQ
jgi:hypothetical protein